MTSTPLITRCLTLCGTVAACLVGATLVEAQVDLQAPSVVSHSPAASAVSVTTTTTVTATFNEPVQAATLVFELRTSTALVVPASVTYDSLRRTVVLDPVGDLTSLETYTATLSGALDVAGNALSAPVAWTFGVTSSGFQDPTVLSGLDAPTTVHFAPDGRVFVAEKRGVIRVFDSLTDPTPDVFADLQTNVHDFGERGLLGMVLDPAFPMRPYLYVLYTHDAAIGGTAPRWGAPASPGDPCPDATGTGCEVSARLSRLQVSGNQMTGPELVLVEDWFQQFPGQSVGDLAFGPDGALYASGGDGAHATLIDTGQLTSPSPDPPGEGGALRSQDLRTPADPVTLSGTLIRVHPDTGLPMPRTPTMTIGTPTTDANGVRSYQVTSAFQGPFPTTVRVLSPTNPAPGKPPRLVYVLPVEPGVTSLASTYSDGLEELRLLDVPNRFNATLIAPSFHIEPWYGDHATNPERRLESFVVDDLVPFGDSLAAAGTAPQRWLVGFSKSGNGALHLILRHPHVFSAAAAWDAPAQFTDLSAFQGMVDNFGTESQFDRYEIPGLVLSSAAAFQLQTRLWTSGDTSAWTPHMQQLDQQMTQASVLHTYVATGPRVHSWYSGWLDGAVTSLDATASVSSPIDLDAQRISAYGLRRPSRFAFRPGTAEIWLGDIGPGTPGTADEVNRIANPSDGTVDNFGWPCAVGTGSSGYAGQAICQALAAQAGAVQTPLQTYLAGQALFSGDQCTTTNGAAITGLAFADAGAYPASYTGALFLADRLRRCIWAVPVGANGQLNADASTSILTQAASPVSLKPGPGGALYYADQDGGTIRRITYTAGNSPPVAVIQAGPTSSGPDPLVVNFSAAGSFEPDGTVLSYAWDLDGDGAFDDSAAEQPTFTYTGIGHHTVLLQAQDAQGLSHVAALEIVVTGSVAATSSFAGVESPLSEGGTWDSPGAWANLQKDSGAYAVGLNAAGRLVTPLVTSDQYTEITYGQDPGSSSWVGAMTRVQGATNGSGYLAIAYAGEVRLYRADDTGSLTFALLASAGADLSALPRRLRLESEGNTHRVYLSGTQVITHTASGTIYTGGQPGIAASVFGGPQVRILSFEAGSLSASTPNTSPVPTITSPANGATFRAGDVIAFSGSATDGEDGTLSSASMTWTVQFHHDAHAHTAVPPLSGTASGTFTIPTSGHDFSGATSYEIVLTVTDSQGVQGTTSVTVVPQKVNLTFATSPTGLAVTIDGVNRATPFVLDTLIGFQHALGAPAQTVGTVSYTFSAWSDGGSQNHAITVPAAAQTYTATFQAPPPPPPPSDLVASYSFNQGSGLSLTEAGGINANGTLVNGPLWTTGRYGLALDFDGTNDHVVVSSPVNLPTADFTVEAWIQLDTTNDESIVMIPNTAGGNEFFMAVESARIGAYVDGTRRARSAVGSVPAATWTHVAATRAGSTIQIFLNGVPSGTAGTFAGAMNFSTCGIYIGVDIDTGCTGGLGNYTNGRIDEVRIYRRALSQAEIQFDMNTPVGTVPTDTTPPVLSSGQPTGTLALGTTQATLSLTTNEAATCRYAATPGVAYGAMPITFATTGGTSHTSLVTGLVNGGSYSYFVRCQDPAGNATPTDLTITFSVAADSTPPVLSNGQPTGTLALGTTQATLSVTTNEAATCRYAPTAGVAYSAMPITFATTGGTSHTSLVTGLANGGSYSYYLRCQDTAGNATLTDFGVAFSVANPPPTDSTPPSVTLTSPTGGTVSGIVTLTANASDNVGVVGVQFLLDGAALGAEDTAAPYSVAWNSTSVANGFHQLAARARDAAGLQTTTTSVGVTVANTATGLVAAYGFNEATGTVVQSAVGSFPGTISGAVWTTGQFGSALSFDGINDWVTVADANALDLTTGMTLEVWVYPTAANGVRDILIKEGTGVDIYNLYARNGQGQPESNVFAGGSNRWATGPTLPLNTWSHVAGTYDGLTVRLFVNGLQVGSTAYTGTIGTSTGVLRIGGNSMWGEFFQGRLDELRIYSRALSAAEIQADMTTSILP